MVLIVLKQMSVTLNKSQVAPQSKEGFDVLSEAARSDLMSKIRVRNTRPEMMVRSLLHKTGFRFRLNVKDLPGQPDIVLPRYKTVIFVHGCFWHGHSCPKGRKLPMTRKEFWAKKLARNTERDKENFRDLRELGWRIVVVWECELKEPASLLERILKEIRV